MSKIFLSYRRADSQDVSGRIYDQLRTTFGQQNVFKDVDSIGGGADFRTSINSALSQSQVMLVIIGPQWLKIADAAGIPRLSSSGDFVRLEIELALQRADLLVIPVLVNGASMPSAEQLPAAIAQLAYRNARTVAGDPDFHHHMERLINEISQQIPRAHDIVGPVSPHPPARPKRMPLSEKLYLVVFLIVLAIVLAIGIPVFIQILPHLYSGH